MISFEPSDEAIRLVILDRDETSVGALSDWAAHRGWDCHVLSGPPTRRMLARMRIDAVVVDPSAVSPDPWGWIGRVAVGLPGLAIVVCAGPSTVGERIQALRLGVDDWLSKPAHPGEVIVRVEGAVRRRRQGDPARRQASSPEDGARPIVVGELEIRDGEEQAFVGALSADLTQREFGVLRALLEQRGMVVEREAIYSRVWGYTMVAGDRSVDVHVRKLRRKLKLVSPRWSYIHTQFRVGYRLQPERLLEERGE
jgi:two-component system, OmpR family, response regulator MprA